VNILLRQHKSIVRQNGAFINNAVDVMRWTEHSAALLADDILPHLAASNRGCFSAGGDNTQTYRIPYQL
jgi:hypothetical protein